jgi:hypothetical protein
MATASMSDRRRAVAALAAQRRDEGAAGRFWKRAAASLALLALLTLAVLWFLGFFSTPEQVAEIRDLVDQQVAQFERAGRGEVPFDSGPGVGAVMAKMREMPREYRQQAGQQMSRFFEARERAEMASYFALPPERRQAELDRRIKADEDRRKTWEAERARRDETRQAAGDGPRGGPVADNTGGRDRGGPPGGGRRGGTEESRNERSKRRIDRSTPEQRARQSEYRRAVEERRKQLGLSPGRRG